ncbi:M48 family metalloprotease [Aestuariivivens sediminis]|uniref:M48 family metalloprotease n=1 Tax=Aestuariivivens sediminis TaxID=2913557 RepID=UPI001F58729F|nr:M48 family metalloprotease [Aestuariivivens sediminis]
MNRTIFLIITFFCFGQPSISINQNLNDDTIKEIFNNVVLAYASPKSPPELIISKELINTPAIYFSKPNPRIVVDKRFLEICKLFNSYSDDAFATVISHELAHYYKDHTFCSDFAFALRNSDKEFSDRLKKLSKEEKIALETEADLSGLYHATIAGYNPFSLYEELLDKIYLTYNLENHVLGYPTKQGRIAIHSKAQQKIAQLYVIFEQGLKAGQKGFYEEAINKFEIINRHFPSRENYNNIGVYYTLKALSIYPLSREAHLHPNRFKYPLKIENESRLLIPEQTRSHYSINQSIIKTSLLNAQKAFEKSISLDPKYYNSFINLACVFDLLANPEAALGKIKELPESEQNDNRVKRIQAIAYYHMGMKSKSEEIWQELDI